MRVIFFLSAIASLAAIAYATDDTCDIPDGDPNYYICETSGASPTKNDITTAMNKLYDNDSCKQQEQGYGDQCTDLGSSDGAIIRLCCPGPSSDAALNLTCATIFEYAKKIRNCCEGTGAGKGRAGGQYIINRKNAGKENCQILVFSK